MEAFHPDGFGAPAVASPRQVSSFRKVINIVGCVVFFAIYWMIISGCRWPVTLDLFVSIGLTELNRFLNESRRMEYYKDSGDSGDQDQEKAALTEKDDTEVNLEKGAIDWSTSGKKECIAAIVGWREDPALFTRALTSYKDAQSCGFVIAGIDGDAEEDMEMVQVFNEVFPTHSHVIHVPEPLGEVAHQIYDQEILSREKAGLPIDYTEIHEIAIRKCLLLAREMLTNAKIVFSGPNHIRYLCIRQRHMHKKGIMFTSYIFSLAIADILGIEFIWSSDSDSIVSSNSISGTVDTMATDPSIGGASSGLFLHNSTESAVARMAETVYWGELYVNRSMAGSTLSSDCQCGPSTMFRLSALPHILIPWYLQTIMGKRMIINEDRHLTTNLLKRGWGVAFASDVLTATDTPTNLAGWLKQQIRWSRGTHIESLLEPSVYAVNHPLLFCGMIKREFVPIGSLLATLIYFFTGKALVTLPLEDLAIRCIVGWSYNYLRNTHRLTPGTWKWLLPGLIFYHVPMPAVYFWSLITLTADGWGTTMRSSSEKAKKDGVWKAWWENGFFVVWMAIVCGSAARWLTNHVFVGLMSGMAATYFFLISAALGSFFAWKATIATTS
ncbi:unnamed protein product [Clonostachys rhizophaga]|uniref:Uncharacterized protein n=1 Tax=Clonostachys rhizophaga TaxID=160324 RepID=A0A9N9VPK4_9HYPO|nr:unnamed protein product [Clonostachys rhizophaga]